MAFQLPADDSYHANLRQLRTNWKWAAFSQFFCTFAPLLAMPDVSLVVSFIMFCSPASRGGNFFIVTPFYILTERRG